MSVQRIKRRAFIAALGGAAAWPLVARAQQPSQKARIGALLPGTPTAYSPRTSALLKGLRDLGYEEGKTVTIEWKWWNDQAERLPELAAELVRLDVQVIVTAGTPATKALKNATRNIPIIMAVIGDPVAAGLVDSLAHPGRNVTGFSILASDLSGKRLELLKEVVPRLSSVGVILNPANPQPKIELKEIEAAAHALGVQIRPIQISAESSLQNSFESISRDGSVQAVIVLTDALLYNHRKQIASLAAANRLPTMYFFREFVADGGLISYGPSDIDLFRRC
jgi:putative tryptophan/tyrosine transport system substrate-binding protein